MGRTRRRAPENRSGRQCAHTLAGIRQSSAQPGDESDLPRFSYQERKFMPLTINREIFDRVKTAIAEKVRINMLSWVEARDSAMVDSVVEIRGSSLLDDCRTTACIGGLICYLATSEEIARAAEIYDLSDNEVLEPSILGGGC
jgi:hypothetical protein